jgi:hypothetical protein
MADNVTLGDVRALARIYADERPETSNGFLTPAEFNTLINLEIRSFYDKLVKAGGHDYYETTASFTVVAGTHTYAFASMTPAATSFYRMRRVQLEWGARDVEEVGDFKKKQEELDLINFASWGRLTPKGYRVIGASVKFAPVPTSGVVARIIYIPAFTSLATDGATFDSVNGWHDLVALNVAMKVRKIQNIDSSDLHETRDEAAQRIEEMAAERAAEEPARVVDVYPESPMGRRGRLWGLPRP